MLAGRPGQRVNAMRVNGPEEEALTSEGAALVAARVIPSTVTICLQHK
jgi:hypothetical protein